MIHILSQHNPWSVLVHNSFAWTVCWQVPLWRKWQSEIHNQKLVQFSSRSAISPRADNKWKFKLKISNWLMNWHKSQFDFGYWYICWELALFKNSLPGGWHLTASIKYQENIYTLHSYTQDSVLRTLVHKKIKPNVLLSVCFYLLFLSIYLSFF